MVKIAILDSGIGGPSTGFKKNTVITKSFCGNDAADQCGHGTHLFGVVVKEMPFARYYLGKVFKYEVLIASAAVARGFRWAIANKVDLILSCVGIRFDDQVLRDVIEDAATNKILLVSAIGNDGDNSLDAGEFPAKYPEVISVGSVGEGDNLSKFSNHPPDLDFLAPGEDIEGLGLDGRPEIMTGTSQAAAYVAGVLGRIIAECKSLGIEYNQRQLVDLLNKTGRKARGGTGLPKIVDGEAALAFVQESVSL